MTDDEELYIPLAPLWSDYWLPVAEVAAILKMSERNIRRYAASGTLPSRMDGGILLVCLPDGYYPGMWEETDPFADAPSLLDDFEWEPEETTRANDANHPPGQRKRVSDMPPHE